MYACLRAIAIPALLALVAYAVAGAGWRAACSWCTPVATASARATP